MISELRENIRVTYVRLVILLSVCFSMSLLFNMTSTKAAVYDNAYNFYQSFVKNNDKPAYLNQSDGYVYFCSWGKTATTTTKYRTVGYIITIMRNGCSDSIELKLGGSLIKDYSEVTKDGITYVLRRCKFSKIQEMFHDSANMTYYDIFQKSNDYKFDAIMTVVEDGKELCRTVREDSYNRTIYADDNNYLFRNASSIKSARKWAAPGDLDNFYNRVTTFPKYQSIEVMDLNYSGSNIYDNDKICYVKKGSRINLGVYSYFTDGTIASNKYHPNYNSLKINGYGTDKTTYVIQPKKKGDAIKAGIEKGDNDTSSPMKYEGVIASATSTYSTDISYFYSMESFTFNVKSGEYVNVNPVGKIFYDDKYPSYDGENRYLCDFSTGNAHGKKFVSDGEGPVADVKKYIFGMPGEYCLIPFSVTDKGSGVYKTEFVRSDGYVLATYYTDKYTNSFSPSNILMEKANSDYTYFVRSTDNVGNVSCSDTIRFVVPKGYNVVAAASGGRNGYNDTLFNVGVYGGNSEISSFVIMSDEEDNASNLRVIAENMNMDNGLIKHGMYKMDYRKDIMPAIKTYPDGEYTFKIISGGRYIEAEPFSINIKKDTSKPVIGVIPKEGSRLGWYRNNVNLNVSIADNYSGIEEYHVKQGKGDMNPYTYQNKDGHINNTYRVLNEGKNIISFYARDYAGNENEFAREVNIDKTMPGYILRGVFDNTNDENKWINALNLSGYIELYDNLSGIYDRGPFEPLLLKTDRGLTTFDTSLYDIVKEGNTYKLLFSKRFVDNVKSSKNNLVIDVEDKAGNKRRVNLYINIDCDPPELELPSEGGWNENTLSGNLIFKDIHAGLQNATISCGNKQILSINYAGENEKSEFLDLNGIETEGEAIVLTLTDLVGNKSIYYLSKEGKGKLGLRTRIR